MGSEFHSLREDARPKFRFPRPRISCYPNNGRKRISQKDGYLNNSPSSTAMPPLPSWGVIVPSTNSTPQCASPKTTLFHRQYSSRSKHRYRSNNKPCIAGVCCPFWPPDRARRSTTPVCPTCGRIDNLHQWLHLCKVQPFRSTIKQGTTTESSYEDVLYP